MIVRRRSVERGDELGGAAADRLAGHAEDDAGRLVLGDRQGAGLAHFEQAPGAVVAHAGHDHARRRMGPAAWAAERKRTSTLGRCRQTGGPSTSSTR